jgi:hypothetical protein
LGTSAWPDERVTVIYVNRGKGLSSVTPGSDAFVTEVVDVEIEAGEKPQLYRAVQRQGGHLAFHRPR